MKDKKQLYNIIAGIGLEIFTIIAGIMMIISLFVPVYEIEGVSTTYIGAISDTVKYALDKQSSNNSVFTAIIAVYCVIIAVIIIIVLISLMVAIIRVIQATINISRFQNWISEGFKHMASLMIFMLFTRISAELAGGLKAATNNLDTTYKISGYWVAVMAVTITGTVIGFVCHVIYNIWEKKMLASILIHSVTVMLISILLMVGAFCSMGTVVKWIYGKQTANITVGFLVQGIYDTIKIVDNGTSAMTGSSKAIVYITVVLLLAMFSYIFIITCINVIKSSMLGKVINIVAVVVLNIVIITFEIVAMIMTFLAGSEKKSMSVTTGAGLIVPLIMSILVLLLMIVRSQVLNNRQGTSVSNTAYENGVYTVQNNTYAQNITGGQNMTGIKNTTGDYVYQNPLYRGKNN